MSNGGIRVSKLRLSLVRVQDFGDHPPLMQPYGYERAFAQTFAPGAAWTLPWDGGSIAAPEALAPPDPNRRFWLKHLEVEASHHFGWRRAWKHLMPLRRRPAPVDLKVVEGDAGPLSDVRVEVDGYCFPASLAVVATIHCDRERTLAEMVDAGIAARGARYDVHWPDGKPAGAPMSLDQLMRSVLGRLRGDIAGAEPRELAFDNQPLLAVAAFLDGRGVDTTDATDAVATRAVVHGAVLPDSDIHRALAALCQFKRLWGQIAHAVCPLDHTTRLWLKPGRYDGDLVFATELRRAIWFPSYFSGPAERGNLHYIGWYHRNLTLAALMTEAVLVQLRRIVRLLDGNKQLGDNERLLAQHAARLVARLYGGKHTYRTDSICHHIDQSLKLVNRVRNMHLITAEKPTLVPRSNLPGRSPPSPPAGASPPPPPPPPPTGAPPSPPSTGTAPTATPRP